MSLEASIIYIKEKNSGKRFFMHVKKLIYCLFLAMVIGLCGCGDSPSNSVSDDSSSTSGTLKDSRDGRTYKTATVGALTWMAENLYYDFNKDDAKSQCKSKGCLYNLVAAMDGNGEFSEDCLGCGKSHFAGRIDEEIKKWDIQGVCPEGWHIPTDEEVEYLKYKLYESPNNAIEITLRGYMNWQLHVQPKRNRYFEEVYNIAPGPTINDDHADPDSDEFHAVRCIKNYTRVDTLPHEDVDVDFGKLVDSRDGRTYKTVKIGSQNWMAENLKFKSETSGRDCYDEDPLNCDLLGRLYDFQEATDICPEGWHLPSSAEFDTLIAFIKDEGQDPALALRSKHWLNEEGEGGENTYGFSALPAGFGGMDEDDFDWAYYQKGVYIKDDFYLNKYGTTLFLSSNVHCDEDEPCAAKTLSISNSSTQADWLWEGGTRQAYVRCVED